MRSDRLPDARRPGPLDPPDHAETYDPGGAGDGARMAHDRGPAGVGGFDDGERGIDDFAEAGRTLREHLGEQLRLTFSRPGRPDDRAHLLALL